jgi:hypothetical protein
MVDLVAVTLAAVTVRVTVGKVLVLETMSVSVERAIVTAGAVTVIYDETGSAVAVNVVGVLDKVAVVDLEAVSVTETYNVVVEPFGVIVVCTSLIWAKLEQKAEALRSTSASYATKF